MNLIIKWMTLVNSDGTATLRQHGFIENGFRNRRYSNELYLSNISLCGKVWVGNGNEENEDFAKLTDAEIMKDSACKICQRKALKALT